MVLVDNKSIASISVRKSTNGSSILVALGLYSLCFSLSLVGVAYNRMLTKRYQRILTPTNQATDDTLSLLRGGNVEEAMGPRICKTKNNDAKDKITWVMFMGDSNMRHTYHWWTTNGGHNKYKFGIKGSSFGMDKTDKGDEYRWADQEILFSEQDDHIVRYSFRFLHGSVSEFVHDTQHWDVARKSAQLPHQWTIRKMKEEQSEAKEADETSAAEGAEDDETEDIWQGRVRPSDFALWATKHKKPIVDNSKVFNTWMDNWEQKTSPDIVILTEGWGGVPRARASEIVRKIVKTNPETLFIWSPVSSSSNVYLICIILLMWCTEPNHK